MFRPPQPKEPVEIDEEEEEESANGTDTGFDADISNKNSVNDLITPKSFFGGNNNSSGSSNGSRGPGPGRNKSKAKNIDLEHKAKKAKTMDDMIAVQQLHQRDFAKFMSNDARAKAFQMAALGFSTFKDDPVESKRYKEIMTNIIMENTANDGTDDVPPLPGASVGAGGSTGAGTGV